MKRAMIDHAAAWSSCLDSIIKSQLSRARGRAELGLRPPRSSSSSVVIQAVMANISMSGRSTPRPVFYRNESVFCRSLSGASRRAVSFDCQLQPESNDLSINLCCHNSFIESTQLLLASSALSSLMPTCNHRRCSSALSSLM